jgi:diguanylate cyclase
MSEQKDQPRVTGSEPGERGSLEAEAAEMRAELARLREELARLRETFNEERLLQLREANEQLVLAALRAERIADIAVRLGRRTAARGRRDSGTVGAKAHQQDLREANEALLGAALSAQQHEGAVEELHRRQVRYLAMVAHELRNPLSPIRTATALLHRIGDDPKMLEQVQGLIGRQVAHMTRLVEDLLDGARAATESFRVERQPVDLGLILAQAVEACQPSIDARRQVLHDTLPDQPLTVSGDADRLAQVFGNLLDNASKYTPAGGDIRLTVTPVDRTICVRVADSGIGISTQGLERVFDLFVQEEHAHASDKRGLGIGLAVVRSLVEAHGGTIVAHSDGLGHGSEFVVCLPMDDAAAGDVAAS